MKQLLALSIVLAISTITFGGARNIDTPVVTNLDNELILKLVNEKRAAGCNCGNKYMPPAPALTWSNVIAGASAAHSRDMNNRNFFSHTSSDGRSLRDRFESVGYKWMMIGENIAMGQRDEYEVVTAWIKSAGHCQNLMNPDFKEMAIARQGKYWTQDFGKKRNW